MAMDISGLNKAVLNTQRKLEQLTENVEKIKSQIYPIGSIYISLSDEDPKTLFGGEWEKIEGRFLLGSSENYILNSTGGEVEHTLTAAEMPAHSHNIKANFNFTIGNIGGSGFSGIPNNNSGWGNYDNAHWTQISASSSGENNPHNNMPPYLVVNVWRRVS